MNRVLHLFREEFGGLHLRLALATALAGLLPPRVGGRIRVALLRLAGLHIGHGTIMYGTPRILAGAGFEKHLLVGRGCWFNNGCTLDVHAPLVIEDGAYLAQDVLVLTQSHEIVTEDRRAGPLISLPVTIGAGAWVGARVTVLPGVTIGAGAVIAAGAVVTRDVPANSVVGGIPAKQLRDMRDAKSA